MIIETATNPKGLTAAAAVPELGCCGGEAAAESRNEASELIDRSQARGTSQAAE